MEATTMGKIAATGKNSLCILGGLAVAGLLMMDWGGSAAVPRPPAEIRYLREGDVIDPPAQGILEAGFEATLVQSGTTLPYTGYGLPGIHLTVKSPDDILSWTFAGWANQTVDDPVCKGRTVYFSQYDWLAQTGGDGNSDSTFITTPSTVPARILPGGDQCVLRATGPGQWGFTVCIEDGPMPEGIYDGEDGRRHIDNFDRCFTKTALV
jgi:hypothetical protein